MLIPRGIIYHTLKDDLNNLFRSFYKNLNDEKSILKFEKKFKDYNKSKYCLSFPFARSAFWTILNSLNLKQGDEIIIPPIQIKGMLEVCRSMKLKTVIVDIDQDNLSFNMIDLQNKITNRTRVILLTYLYGIVPNLDVLFKKIKKKKLIVVEDFSQCLFGKFKNRYVGNFGNFGIYSLSATKTLDTYGGGILVTNEKKNFLKILNTRNKYFENYSRLILIKKILLSFVRNFFLLKFNFFFVINFFKFLNVIGIDSYKRFVGTRDKKLLNKLPQYWFHSYTALQAQHGLKYLKNVKKENKIRKMHVEQIQLSIGKKFFCKNEKLSENVYWQCPFFFKNYKYIQNKSLFKNIDIAQPSIVLLTSIFQIKNYKANYIYEKMLLLPCYHTLKKIELKKLISTIKNLCQK